MPDFDFVQVLDLDAELLAAVDDFTSVSWVRRFYGNSSFKLEIHPRSLNLNYFQTGRLVVMPDGEQTFMIEQIEYGDNTGDQTQDKVTVTGKRYGMLEERSVKPPVGLSHDEQITVAAETAMKHYVNLHAGPGAAVARRVPNLSLAADLGRGAVIAEQVRYDLLLNVLVRISEASGLGWDIERAGDQFTFDVIEGTDRSGTVYFDQEFDTLLGQKFLTTIAGRKTFAYVLGQGVGAARTVVERYVGGAEPTGLQRREVAIDARDISDATALQERGDSKLAETAKQDSFEFEYNPEGSFQYREHWDVGDVVTARNGIWGITTQSRVISVEEIRDGNGKSIKVEVGRAWPTLKAIQDQIVDGLKGSSFE